MTLGGLRFGPLPAGHVPDLLRPGLRLVFCGTALGRVSAERQAYYAHPGNLFWRTLHATGLTPVRLAPEEWPRLADYGIGLTDVCKTHFGNDAELPATGFDGEALRQKIFLHQPAILAFTSKKAASALLGRPTGRIALGFLAETIGATRLCVLPSPSGQARTYWSEAPWQELADAAAAIAASGDGHDAAERSAP